jgi:hypothetical protein
MNARRPNSLQFGDVIVLHSKLLRIGLESQLQLDQSVSLFGGDINQLV